MNDANIIQFHEDVRSDICKELIQRAIATYGFAEEHTYECFLSSDSDNDKAIFVSFGNDRGLFSVRWHDGHWEVISEVICPLEERGMLLHVFAKEVFEKKGANKIYVEVREEVRGQLRRALTKREEHSPLNAPSVHATADKHVQKKIVLGRILERYVTPIISLSEWNPELEGSAFSKLRKAKQRFFRKYAVEILTGTDCMHIPFEAYEQLVHAWRKFRKNSDHANYEDYIAYFKNELHAADCVVAIKINGTLRGVACTWCIPNTNQKMLYYAMNLHDYSIPELGDFLTCIFFDHAKHAGYTHVNFGSSDKKLLAYKNKFKPSSYFSSVRFFIHYKNADITHVH